MLIRVSTLSSVTGYLSAVGRSEANPPRCSFVQSGDSIVAFAVNNGAMAEYSIYSYEAGLLHPLNIDLGLLSNVAGGLSHDENVRIWESDDKNRMHRLRSGHARFNLCASTAPLPVSLVDPHAEINLAGTELLRAFGFAKHALAGTGAGANYKGMYIESSKERFSVVATDGCTLAAWTKKKNAEEAAREDTGKVVIPASHASLVADTCMGGSSATISISENLCEVQCGQRRAIVPSLGEFFPPWRRLVRLREHSTKIRCQVGDLVSAYREATIGSESGVVLFEANESSFSMQGRDVDSMASRNASADGVVDVMAINLKKSVSCISSLDPDLPLRIECYGPGKQIIIRVRQFVLAVMQTEMLVQEVKDADGKKAGKQKIDDQDKFFFARRRNVEEYVLENPSDQKFEPVPASSKTSDPPGSMEKIEEMRKRMERGEDIWHKDDPTVVQAVGEYAMEFFGIDTSDES